MANGGHGYSSILCNMPSIQVIKLKDVIFTKLFLLFKSKIPTVFSIKVSHGTLLKK